MAEVNQTRLHEFAARLQKLFEEYSIESNWFHFSALVSGSLYESIKHNFPDRHPADRIVNVKTEYWDISLIRAFDSSTSRSTPYAIYRAEEIQLELEEKPQEKPEWTQFNNEHVIILPQGRAVIRKEAKGGITLYNAHIEDNSGNIITQYGHGYKSFENANDYIRANLIELDRVGVDEAAFHQKLATTLDKCIDLFTPTQPSHVFHRLRLENIKRWFLNQHPEDDLTNAPTTDWANYTFIWQQQDGKYHSETPHGKATINEPTLPATTILGMAIPETYSVEIEDDTGVVLKDHYGPLPDFLSAEARLREVLTELEQPFVNEVYQDYLTFALQICLRLLPQDADPMDLVRIEYIDTHLGTVLP